MVRYKRYRRRRSPSTNIIKMKFQSFMDIYTVPDSMQIISISAGGKNLLERLPLQFQAYKYYKIGSVSVKLVPASTLPVDPTGLSLEAGEQTVNPIDQLSPGMMRITNGEDILEDLTGVSAPNQRMLYNSMLLDPRWFKWMLQSGVKRHATPRYWQIGQLHQDKWPGAFTNYPYVESDGDVKGTFSVGSSTQEGVGNINSGVAGSSPYGLFQTGHRGVLGWLPTDGLQPVTVPVESATGIDKKPFVASPPEIEVMKIILPPVYKTNYYYRLFITETCYFREPVLMTAGGYGQYYRPLDVFHYAQLPVPMKPTTPYTGTIPDSNTGGNYGDD